MNEPAVLAEPLTPNQRAWRRFRRNQPAMISSAFLALLLVLVVFWPLLAPYAPDAISDAQFQPPEPAAAAKPAAPGAAKTKG